MGETERSEKSRNIPENLALSDCRISPVLFRFERVGAGSYRGATTSADVVNVRWKSFREWYRFTGNEDDAEVGLSYHGARYYSPSLKRFISADPVTVHEAGSDINPYSYGYGNPTSYVDPDGRDPFTILAVVGIAMFIGAGTSIGVQLAVHGEVREWGWSGVLGAAVAGGVGSLVGMGVAGPATGLLGAFWGGAAAGAVGGAAGGATGAALGGGDWTDVGNGALLGAVSGAVGGGVGILAGSNAGGWAGFGGTMAGTGAGTTAGIGFGWAAMGQDPTWQSAGIAFASAFGGAIASAALSKTLLPLTQSQTEGRAGRPRENQRERRTRERREPWQLQKLLRLVAISRQRAGQAGLRKTRRAERVCHWLPAVGWDAGRRRVRLV